MRGTRGEALRIIDELLDSVSVDVMGKLPNKEISRPLVGVTRLASEYIYACRGAPEKVDWGDG